MSSEDFTPPPGSRREIHLERIALGIALAWLLGYWLWAHATQHNWVFEDDPIRINYVQNVVEDHSWPHTFGFGWLPLPTIWMALFAAAWPGTTAMGCSAANLAAMAGFIVLTRNLALSIARPACAALVSLFCAFTPIAMKLAASALSEPLYLFTMAGAAAVLGREASRHSMKNFAWGIGFLMLAQMNRYEAWWITVPSAGVLCAIAWRRGGCWKRFSILAFAATLLFPWLWMMTSWLNYGHPWKWLADIQQSHLDASRNLSLFRRLGRVALCFKAVLALAHALSLFGIVVYDWRARWRPALPMVLLGGLSYAFLIMTAVTGTFTYVGLERFLAIPVLLLLPMAGVGMEWIIARHSKIGWTLAILAALHAPLWFVRSPKQYDVTSHDIRRDAMLQWDRLVASNPRLDEHGMLHVMPEGHVDALNNSMHAFRPNAKYQWKSVAPDMAVEDILRVGTETDAGVLVIDGRLETARNQLMPQLSNGFLTPEWVLTGVFNGHFILARVKWIDQPAKP